jgi:hypothetical protein
MKELKICSRCVLDTTVNDIWFDDLGQCKYCNIHDEMDKLHPISAGLEKELEAIIRKIKLSGKNKKYDCIAGVSGGRDSTYTLLTAVRLGLRPLAVHFDNGWNSDISVQNIRKACDILKVDLYTVVADWEEFKDLQLSFLKASTPDADVPTDYAIYSVLYHVANKEHIRYILNGHSYRTEGTSPISWTYMDPLYVRSVHRKFGKLKKFRSFPHMTFAILTDEIGWQYYGGHHHENLYTRFFQSYYLPKKFGIDKRKVELSALIRSGQISREEALQEIYSSPYMFDDKTVEYAYKKLGLSREEFHNIMNLPQRSYNDYPNYLRLIRILRKPIKIAAGLKLVPQILYLKYAAK